MGFSVHTPRETMRYFLYSHRWRLFLVVLGEVIGRSYGFDLSAGRDFIHEGRGKAVAKDRFVRHASEDHRTLQFGRNWEDSNWQASPPGINRTVPVHIMFVNRRGVWDKALVTKSTSDSENGAGRFPIVIHVKLEFVCDFMSLNSFTVDNLPRDKPALASATTRDIGPLDFSPVFQQPVSRQPQSECEYRDENSGHSDCGVAIFISNVKATSGIDGNVISDRERTWWALVFGLLGFGGCLACYAVIKRRGCC